MLNRLLTRTLTAIALVSSLLATEPAFAQTSAEPNRAWLDVEVGQSRIEKSSRAFHRVLISDDTVAEIKLLETGQFQIRGLAVGTTDLWIWYKDDPEHPVVLELTVRRDLSDVVRRVDAMVSDGAPPLVYPLKDHIVAEGPVPDLETLEAIAALIAVYDPEFINLMTVRGDQQVQLEVTFAEVSRSAMREMGLNVLWGTGGNAVGLVNAGTSGDRALVGHGNGLDSDNNYATSLINSGVVASAGTGAFALAGVLGNPVNIAAVLSVLEEHNLTKIIASPTAVVLSGQQAEFLAGGEIPIPVAQNNNRISLEFKEYGVKLVFVPTVLSGEVIDLRVQVEVSEIDSATGTRITGIEIPGFLVRKSESHLRISNGMTFAMAGMLSETVRYTRAEVPLLGDIPILGALFAYTSHQRDETELMIFITPKLVRPLAEGEVPPAPGMAEDNNPNDFELFWLGMDHRASSRTAEPTGPVGAER